MAAKIISIGNQKGGVGKSTVTMQLAGALSRCGFKVLVVDADEQATVTKWSAMSEETPFPASVVGLAAAGAKLHREIQKFVDLYDFIIVDCSKIDAISANRWRLGLRKESITALLVSQSFHA